MFLPIADTFTQMHGPLNNRLVTDGPMNMIPLFAFPTRESENREPFVITLK
jgi:hypothetical protein